MKKYFKRLEKGRSVIDMLSVMAMVAVLTIVGMTGYKYLIAKYKANEIINHAHIGYMELVRESETNGWATLSTKNFDGNPLQGYLYGTDGFVLVSDIEYDVCKRVLADNGGGYNLLTEENMMFDTCTENGANNIIFDFGNIGSMNFPCSVDDGYYDDGEYFTDEFNYPHDEECFDNQYCSEKGGKCMPLVTCADPEPVWNKYLEVCISCFDYTVRDSDGVKPIWDGAQCITCHEKTGGQHPFWDIEAKECTSCPPDMPKKDEFGNCLTCAGYDENKPFYSEFKGCITCATADPTKPKWDWDAEGGEKCVACYDYNPKEPLWDGENCFSCADTIVDTSVDNKYKLKIQWDGNDGCITCAAATASDTDGVKPAWDEGKEDCISCEEENADNPIWNASTSNCISCNTSTSGAKPFWDAYTKECKTCYEANTNTPVWVSGDGCVSCEMATADATNGIRPIWDNAKKNCVTCATSTNNERPIYQGSSCVSCLTSTGGDYPYYNGSSCGCPAYSSETVTPNRIGTTNCYCNAGYTASGDSCIVQ